MTEVVTNVMGSRRLRRFTATYAVIYIAAVLVMNYIGGLSVFEKAPMSYLFSLLNFTVQTPILFGCVRGIVTRDYNVSRGLGAFTETDKYPFYLAYILLNVAFSIVYGLVSSLAAGEGTLATVGLVLSAVMLAVQVLLNFLLVGVLFAAIFTGEKKPRLSVKSIFDSFVSGVTKNPGKVIAAEIFTVVINYLALYVAAILAEALPAHWTVPFILTCFAKVQFGFIIFSWPIYYLYCKKIYGITEYDEPVGHKLGR